MSRTFPRPIHAAFAVLLSLGFTSDLSRAGDMPAHMDLIVGNGAPLSKVQVAKKTW